MSDNPFDDEGPAFGQTPPPPPDTSSKKKSTKITLTDEQKKFIDGNWDKMDLMEVVRHIFKNDNLDGRSKEGSAVRDYMREKNFTYKTSGYEKKADIELTEEHKEFAIKYAKDMKPYEIARVLFKDDTLHQFSKEAFAVQFYIKQTNPALLRKDDEATDEDYSPPKTFKACWRRICEVTAQFIEEDKLNVKTRKCVEKALEFLQTPRFVLTATNLRNVSERSIFESEYLRSVWDKPDLTADEINLYISLTNEYVIQDRVNRIVGKLNFILENVTSDPDGKVSISLSEAIKGKSEELHRSLSRQQDFVKDLSGKRSTRIAAQTARAKSLVSLVEAFRDETERKNAIRLAELRKKAVVDEMTRLENMDDWECRVFGISKEEIEE